MNKIFLVFSINILILTMCGCASTKVQKVDEALEKKQIEKEKDAKRVKNDKTKPKITSSSDEVVFDVSKTIDSDYLLNYLEATDDVDGDITDKIKKVSDDIVQYQEGNYTAIYSVKDRAGNKTKYSLQIKVTSKYDEAEKNRLMNATNGYFVVRDNKNLTDLFFSNIISTESGEMILFEYSGDDNRGDFECGRIVYYAVDGHIQELPENSAYPSEFQGTKFEYDEDNLENFIKYYHLS